MPFYKFAFQLDPMALHECIQGVLPVHCPLVHWFQVESSPSELLYLTRNIFEEGCEVRFDLEKPASLGRHNSIRIFFTSYAPDVEEMHMRLYLALGRLGAKHHEPTFLGERYRPYVAVVHDRPRLGWTFKSDRVNLIVRECVHGTTFKRVCGVFHLAKGNA